VPTLRASVTDLKLSIRCLIRSLISVALMAILIVILYALRAGLTRFAKARSSEM
jgi:hypothetical protein